MTTVLVTGAAGGVARMLRPGLDGLTLRAVDTRAITGWDAETMTGDLADPTFAGEAVRDVTAVVHLAANPSARASWDNLRSPNIDTVVTIVDAARAAGVERVVLASSVHAMGGYRRPGVVIDADWPARPCCVYGATKVFAEAYGAMVAATGDMSVLCLRLGGCLPEPHDTGNLASWLGPADLQHLVRSALTADVRYGTYVGVSANTRGIFDIGNARRELGYRPLLDSEPYAHRLPEGDGGSCPVPS